jgi:hypothetical protein
MAEELGNNDHLGLRHVALDELRVDLAGAESARKRGRQRSRNQGLGGACGVAAVAAIVVVAATVAPGRHNGTVQPSVTTGVTTASTTSPAPAPTTAAPSPAPVATQRRAVPPPVLPATAPSVGAVATTPSANPSSTGGTTQASAKSKQPVGLVDAVNGFGAAKAIVHTATGSCLQVDLRQLLEGAAADAWAAAHPSRAERLGNLAVIADPDDGVLHCIPLAASAQVTLNASPPPGAVVTKVATLAILADLLVQLQSHKPNPPGDYWIDGPYYRWHLDGAGAIDRINAYYVS